jgi:hypothetical protein
MLYLALIVATALPLFFNIKLPNEPSDASIDLFTSIMDIPDGSSVLLSTEWTNATRAENAGEFEAVVRMLEHKHVKFAIFSIGDAQAPPVAVDEITKLNAERIASGEKPYERWTDWVDLGFYPNAEGTASALASNVRGAFAGKQDINPQGKAEDVFDSPVLQHMQTLKDVPVFFEVTASSTSTVYIQRISKKVPMALLVTGVMGPEAIPYYASGQVVGLSAGLKGVLDLESMMVTGVNVADANGRIAVSSAKHAKQYPGFLSPDKKGKGATYFPALHVAMLLLILAIIVGNVGMFLTKRGQK